MSAMRIRTTPALPFNALRRVGNDPIREAFDAVDKPVRFTKPLFDRKKSQRMGRMSAASRMAQAFADKLFKGGA